MNIPWGDWREQKGFVCYRVFFMDGDGRAMTFEDVEWPHEEERRVWHKDWDYIERALLRYEELRLAAGLACERVVVKVYAGSKIGSIPCVADLEVEW